MGWGPEETLVGLFGPASATSLDAVTLGGGEAEVLPIHPRTPPGRKSKIQFGLGGGGVLRVVSSMEAPSWEDLLFGGEIIWMVGSEYLQQWRWCGGCQVVRRCVYRVIDDEWWRHGAAAYQRWMRLDGRAQGGRAVWRHGGVDDRPGKVCALVPALEMDRWKKAAITLVSAPDQRVTQSWYVARM